MTWPELEANISRFEQMLSGWSGREKASFHHGIDQVSFRFRLAFNFSQILSTDLLRIEFMLLQFFLIHLRELQLNLITCS